eukprot:m.7190 g.7190  ORF g.7190 m.7190 type:complete len:271 (-) comp3662_c0_seq1:121-933(-)
MVDTNTQVSFIGGGNMGTAIAEALELLPSPPKITICDVVPAILEKHAAKKRKTSSSPLVAGQDVVILAVKPQVAPKVIPGLKEEMEGKCLVISIMAGITIPQLESWLPQGQRVVRCMPNTPMAIGEGMTGICPGTHATEKDLDVTKAIFSSAGKVVKIDTEDMMNSITAVSGSGPAYLFRFAEAQVAAAMKLGFSKEDAQILVGQTLKGSIEYLLSKDGFPAATLREQVTSPGGTTAAGLGEMNKGDVDGMMEKCFVAARDRGQELAKSS